jgi:hypothetical protein
MADNTTELDYAAPEEQYNSAPISIGRFGAYVRSELGSTASAIDANFVAHAVSDTDNPSYSFSGVLHEVIVFDRKLSEVERQQVYQYISQKYNLNTTMPDSFPLSHPSAYSAGFTYWSIENHPNSKGLDAFPAGLCFGGITISDFLFFPDTIYKSAGSRLSDFTVLSGDTYNTSGF